MLAFAENGCINPSTAPHPNEPNQLRPGGRERGARSGAPELPCGGGAAAPTVQRRARRARRRWKGLDSRAARRHDAGQQGGGPAAQVRVRGRGGPVRQTNNTFLVKANAVEAVKSVLTHAAHAHTRTPRHARARAHHVLVARATWYWERQRKRRGGNVAQRKRGQGRCVYNGNTRLGLARPNRCCSSRARTITRFAARRALAERCAASLRAQSHSLRRGQADRRGRTIGQGAGRAG